MGKGIWTDALREVRGTLGRFFSLLLLSALAVAFLAGLRTTAPNMERSADRYYDGQGLMDLRVLSTLGLTEEDIDALAAADGVEEARGAYTIDAIVQGEENDFIVKALSLDRGGLNRPRLVEGRLPEHDGECLVEPKLLMQLGMELGEEITLDTGAGTFANALVQSRFMVVGTADSPLYLSTERGASSLGSGRVAAFLLLPEGAFQMEAYTDAYLRATGAEALICYSDGYEDLIQGLTDGLEPLGERRADLRREQVVTEAQGELESAQSEFDQAEAEAEAELADGRRELADARGELDQGWSDYHRGRADFEAEIAEARQSIYDAEHTELPDALAQLEQGEIDYTEGEEALVQAREDYEAGLAEYQDGVLEYDQGYGQLLSENLTYDDSLQQLRDGEAEFAAGVQRYGRGLDELQEGGRQIQDSEKKLADALEQLFAGEQALSAGRAEYEQGSLTLAAAQQQFGLLLGGLAQVGGVTPEDLLTPGAALPWSPEVEAVLTPALGQVPGLEDVVLLSQSGDPTADYALPGFLQTMKATLEEQGAVLEAAGGQIASAEHSLAWGRMEYEDGRAQLNAAKRTFFDSADQLQEAGQTLTDSRRELDEGWAQLRDGEEQLDQAWSTLNDAKVELAEAQATLEDGWSQLQQAQEELVEARRELDQGWADYHQGLEDLEEAKATLAREEPRGRGELADALGALEDGERDYEEGLADYHQGKAEADEKLSDARRALNDARRAIAQLDECSWYLLGRDTNIGYMSFQSDAQRMGNLASVFPLIFFLVAALVCLTTMTRMVEEHRVQIGSLKALGYGVGAISVKYVGYGLAASLLGGLLGLGVGCILIPTIIYTAWTTLYTLGPLEMLFYPGISLLAVGAAVLTVAGAALLTCRSALREVPAALMRPRAPKMGKRVLLERVGFLWRRLSFSQKVTVRNLFRYKRRFWMTVAGIGGCTALIVAGFGLRDSIFSIMDRQYEELFRYTSQIGLVEDVTEEEGVELRRLLDRSAAVTEYREARQETVTALGAERSMEATLLCPREGDFGDFLTLRHRRGHQAVTLPQEGAVLTEKLAALLGVGEGDQVTLDGETRVSVTVAGVVENYIGHYVYLSAAAYKAAYGAPPEGNLVLARYADGSRETADGVSAELIALSGVTSVSRIEDTRKTYQSSLESVDYAVVVIIAAAAALAFVVLFNLTNINITERLRELATLKVLGFREGELRAYVFRENALLTVFGVGAGLVMGKLLHQWLVLTVEIDMLMFGRAAKPMSYLYAVVLTVLFSVAVNLVAGRKLREIDMVESLKTVE